MRCRALLRWLIAIALAAMPFNVRADELDGLEWFEAHVRPILVEHCHRCHGPDKRWANLRLDSRESLLKGGDSGPAVTPGQPDKSELLRRVSEPDESLRMPPADEGPRLTDSQIAALTKWVELGAPWPEHAAATDDERQRAWDNHWAFQPIRDPAPPDVEHEAWIRTPIDRFILRKLEERGLSPSPAADRRTLIRRATYDLTGLPPTPEEVEAFARDESPDAYARIVDRLLASPRYGEQWGRHWLDVARYSDTKGYVYAREERFFVHSSLYRDWIVRAFNEDLPYNRFLLLQIAADQAAPEEPGALAAMGFLTLGRRFIGVTPDVIDDRIDVVTRGTMGLTVACARCHDHKYDPIPTADYYSLYGVFQNSVERLLPVARPANAPAPPAEFDTQLHAKLKKLEETIAARSAEASERIRQRLPDYLLAQRELEKYPVQGFDIILAKNDLIPATVRRWEAYLLTAAERRDPIFLPWVTFAALPDDGFAAAAVEATRTLNSDPTALNPRIAAAFIDPPVSLQDVADRYGQVFAEIARQWRELCETAVRENRPPPEALPNADDEDLRQVLYGPGSPCVIPAEPIVNTESLYDSGTVDELWKLQNEVDRHLLQAPGLIPHAVVLTDRNHIVNPRIFRRGNAANKDQEVPLRFLQVASGELRQPFTTGSGRLEMARAIVDPTNPLTARVWVNRVWMHHFGSGLVRTPSDFGLRANPPSHPELLDWLASELIAHGWSTKSLHRTIMLSATYQQCSTAECEVRSAEPDDSASIPHSELPAPHSLDPENRLLWRMNARRLGYEELRDTLLALSGELDPLMGGKAVEPFPTGAGPLRRSLYGVVDRQFVPSVLRIFDFANPDLHSPQRSETTVPQQALFALNHPFVAARAQALARRLDADADARRRIARLYGIVFQREPTTEESAAALAFVEAAQVEAAERRIPAAVAAWSYGYGELDEQTGRLKTFQPLPHFNGSAWQGGPQWPDADLGWVQLTAAGGHPGNDLQHAAVRRWTAPRAGTVAIASTAIHEVPAGDGIRCRIVSSRHGVLKSVALHNAQQAIDIEAIAVEPGDTLDFIVDIHANLNSDQFLWAPEIHSLDAGGNAADLPTHWSAEAHFAGPRPALLDPWAQLAQVLLVSNELMFVD